MGRRQTMDHLENQGTGLIDAHRLRSVQPVRKSFASQQLDRENDDVAFGCGMALYIEYPADICMCNLACKLDLFAEPAEGVAFRSKLRADSLQRHWLAQLQIEGFVDLTHAAPSE